MKLSDELKTIIEQRNRTMIAYQAIEINKFKEELFDLNKEIKTSIKRA
jgi:hypothetical protein